MPTVVANTSFTCAGHVSIHEGQLFDSKDPVVKGREHLFDPVEESAKQAAAKRKTTARKTPAVEQATAAPGEKR
jgi:hypothetical protein